MAKKELMNFVEINGEVIDVYNERTSSISIGDENFERYEFMMKIKTDEDMIREIKFNCPIRDNEGNETNRYKGFQTIFDEVKIATDSEDGKGERISTQCRVINNNYYYKGQLFENVEFLVDFAHREKDNRKFDDNASFSLYSYIKEIVENEESLDFHVLVNEYVTSKTIKGHNLVLKVLDKELFNDFKETYKEGDIAKLEGVITDQKVKVEIPKEDLVELEVKGIGTARQKIIEENAKRKEMRENGVYKIQTTLELTGGYEPLSDKEIEEKELPFTKVDIKDMLDGINEKIDKSKEKDMKKYPNSYKEVDDSDVPF